MFGQFAFGDFSTTDLVIILIILLLLFGSKKLPELSRSIGQSVKELRNAASGDPAPHPEKKKVGRPARTDSTDSDKK